MWYERSTEKSTWIRPETGLYHKGDVLEKVVLFIRLQTGTAYRWRLRRAIGYHCREWRKLLRLSAFWHTLKELAPVRQRFFRAYIKKPLINSGFPCGERGSQTYGFLEYHKIRNSCMSAICKISQKLGYHRISFRIAIFGCRIGCRFWSYTQNVYAK